MKTKIFTVLVLLLFIFCLTSCSKFEKIEEVNATDLFNKGGEYYVYIYRPNCAVCERVQKTVEKYFKAQKKNSNLITIYRLNRGIKENYDALSCKDPENPDSAHFLDATSLDEMSCCSTPILLRIKGAKVVEAYDLASQIENKLLEAIDGK